MIDFARLTYPTRPFIGGRYIDAISGDTFESLNPATGEVLAHVAACNESDVDVAVAVARETFESGVWSQADPSERKRVLFRFADLIDEHAEELALLDSIEAGKPITDCLELDLPSVSETIRWYAEAIDKVFGQISPTGKGNLGLITREPVGVVATVVPWNFPLGTLSWKLGPSLASGNSVIVKPAELTSFSSLRIAEIATEAGLPDGVLNVVPGLGHIAGKALGLHNEVDMVSFTGSTEVGGFFLKYAADSNMKKVVLELGGKSPQVILEDNVGRLDAIAEELAGAAFWNMGENCTCGSRILVHESLREEFVEKLAAAAAKWTVGNPQNPETKIGALIEEAHLNKVLGYIQQGIEEGAQLAYGGTQLREESGGWFVGPTIFTDVTQDMKIAQEEIFGPVVSVIGFETEEQAIAFANDTSFGLAASLFTQNLNAAVRVSRAIRAGTVSVNCYSEGDITTPFGGTNRSGFGGYDKGIEAFDQYTALKTTWIALD